MLHAHIAGTYLDDISAACWLVVAIGTGMAVFWKTCTNTIECSALSVLSISAFARAIGIWNRDAITPDSALVAISAAAYVLVRYYQEWRKDKEKDDAEALG
ncbi:MAG TPA: hypothetical protein VF681_00020 [Abditibacteriaceae bacterium]|jgi:uncharacterized membrane protein